MSLEELGYTPELENYRKSQHLDSFGIGRVISEHRERYIVKTAEDELDAEVIGALRFSAHDRADFPAVGDWVAISEYDENKALIHSVLPRKTILERQTAGTQGEKQIIATNIDLAFIVQAVDRDFNINRMERYLILCHSAGVTPVIVLNKIDLISETDLNALIRQVEERVKQVPVVAISNISLQGFASLTAFLTAGSTCCLLGSSGVGKSTLINQLSGKDLMHTGSISLSTGKGRHVTSHRELFVLKNGGILIDNPGMREVGIADSTQGIEMTFDEIGILSGKCKYKDCTHTNETGCAVLEALENGEIDRASYDNYLKLEKEKAHYESTVSERRQKEREFGKILKNYKKDMKKNRD
jgi:ribosome biogenesis GTPase